MMASEPWGVSEQTLRSALEAAATSSELGTRAAGGDRDGDVEAAELLQRFQAVCAGLLRVTSENEAMNLLLSSSRVMEDVAHTRDHGEAGWDMSVSLRAWDSAVKMEREFRTFVVGGQLAAVTQYDHQLRYPWVGQHLQGIVDAILRCLEDMRPKLQELGLASESVAIVVDFLVVPSSEAGGAVGSTGGLAARVIELNPFGPVTGAAFFTWTTDRRKMQGGRDLYGDLDEHERLHPAGSVPLPEWMEEELVCGVPFRYAGSDPPGITRECLEVFWPDYLRLAPPELLGRRPGRRPCSGGGGGSRSLSGLGKFLAQRGLWQ